MKQSEAAKHIRAVQLAAQKTRSNIEETLGDNHFVLGWMHPYLFPEYADPPRTWGILDMATRILDVKGDKPDPQDYLNLTYAVYQDSLLPTTLHMLHQVTLFDGLIREWEPEDDDSYD